MTLLSEKEVVCKYSTVPCETKIEFSRLKLKLANGPYERSYRNFSLYPPKCWHCILSLIKAEDQ